MANFPRIYANWTYAGPPVGLAASPVYERTDCGVQVAGQNGTRLYGINLTTGNWVYTDDGDTWTDTGVSRAPDNPPSVVQLVFHGEYVFAVGTAGQIYRNAPETWTGWVDKSVPDLPAGTTWQVDVLASNGTYLFYGNYNSGEAGGAHVWRSADDGDNWAEVLTVADGLHVHAIRVDPANSSRVFVAVGDALEDGKGLYYSADSGTTWRKLGGNRYPINMVIPAAAASLPSRVIMEGDGLNQPHTYMYDFDRDTGVLEPLVWAGATWGGTSRGIHITSEGNLFWITTAENGVVGTKEGLWMARGPWFTRPVLLEDATGADPIWYYLKTYELGPYLFNQRYRMVRPKFEGQ